MDSRLQRFCLSHFLSISLQVITTSNYMLYIWTFTFRSPSFLPLFFFVLLSLCEITVDGFEIAPFLSKTISDPHFLDFHNFKIAALCLNFSISKLFFSFSCSSSFCSFFYIKSWMEWRMQRFFLRDSWDFLCKL